MYIQISEIREDSFTTKTEGDKYIPGFSKALTSQRILILGRHILTLLTFRLHRTHMAPFSVNMTRTELCSVMGRFRSGVGLGLDR